jgi:hypothetical protein
MSGHVDNIMKIKGLMSSLTWFCEDGGSRCHHGLARKIKIMGEGRR